MNFKNVDLGKYFFSSYIVINEKNIYKYFFFGGVKAW